MFCGLTWFAKIFIFVLFATLCFVYHNSGYVSAYICLSINYYFVYLLHTDWPLANFAKHFSTIIKLIHDTQKEKKYKSKYKFSFTVSMIIMFIIVLPGVAIT